MTNYFNSPQISILSPYKNPKTTMISRASSINPTICVHLDPAGGLTASPAPKLHWQLAVTRKGSIRK